MTDEIQLLIVDDDAVDVELTQRLLNGTSQLRFAVHKAANLREATTQLRAAKFDVLLLDLGLADCHGLETLDRIQQEKKQLPIIVLTGLSDEATALRSLDHGAQDFLVKGTVTSDMLIRSIRYAIQRQQLVQELGRAKALLQRKNRRLAKLYNTAHRFVDNVSHEFRTPLTVIKEYTALLREGFLGSVSPEQCEILDVVSDRADDLNNMVDDMLDISKLEAGLFGAWRKNHSVAHIADRIRSAMQRKAGIKNITLDFDIDPALPPIYCDDEKIARVLINLTINAIKFSPNGSSVRVWAREDANSPGVLIGVTDSGPGISPDALTTIFERFRQLGLDHQSDSAACKGFGLGLSIAKELVELNFGEMRVDSALGHGSTFSFLLPPADPLEITTRYLSRLHQSRNSTSEVTLIEASIDPATNAILAEDVEGYLNGLLKRNDLLFQASPTRWVLVLGITELELDKFLSRATTSIAELNRNRLRGPLPEIEFLNKGNWLVTDNQEAILANLGELLESMEPAHA